MVNKDSSMEQQCLFMLKDLKANSPKQLQSKKLLKIKNLFLKTNWERQRTWVKANLQQMKTTPMVSEMWQEVTYGMLQSVFMENQLRKNFSQIETQENLQRQGVETRLEDQKMTEEYLDVQQLEQISLIGRRDLLQITM